MCFVRAACLAVFLAFAAACSPATQCPAEPAVAPVACLSSAPSATVTQPTAIEPAAAANASTAPSATPPPPPSPEVSVVKLLFWKRELVEPVRSLAIGKPRVAALGARVWLREGGAWGEIPLSPGLLPADGERDDVRIFFGRDDRPRIMGARLGPNGERAVYLRWRDSWKREKKELARLAGEPPGALYGVLGHDDPEIVCKVTDICIIKRRTGWTSVPTEPLRLWVEVAAGRAYALDTGRLLLLGDAAFEPHASPVPFAEAGGVGATSPSDVWVSEPGAGRIHHFDGSRWASSPSPVDNPRGLWAATPSDVWLVGDEGAAHFDGTNWARVEGPSGPLAEVRGRDGEVFVAGATGVWRGVPTP